MNAAVVLGGVALGAALGPVQRARIFHHTVTAGRPWRRECPHCACAVIASGWRGLMAVLPSSGRCPHCARRIGPAAFTVEVLTATVCTVLAVAVDPPLLLVACWWIATIGVALGVIDVAVHRLPDQLTIAALIGVLAALGAAVLVGNRPAPVLPAILGGIVLGVIYLVLVLAYPAGMGVGDTKLALSLGTLLGWVGSAGGPDGSGPGSLATTGYGAAAGFVLAGTWSVLLLVSGRAGRRTQIPHGPFMLLGTLATIAVVSFGAA